MRFLERPNFDFIGARKKGYVVSAVLVGIGLISIIIRGFQLGIDFKGGTEIVARFQDPINIGEVRKSLGSEGLKGQIKEYGSAREVIITTDFSGELNELQSTIERVLKRDFPNNPSEVIKVDAVGPSIAGDLQWSAISALIGALAMILLYVGIRFEFKFATAGVIAIFHDVLVVAGLFSLLGGVFDAMPLEVDQSIIAAFLTIVGYSITDTVVVYDRIRENLKIRKSEPYEKIFNDSLNETLSRTIITSGTTLLTALVLFIFAGQTIRGFAFAIVAGILIGTYSSVFIAAPIVLDWQLKTGGKFKLRG
ncbi:MAG: protein translocase subunit SecF [Chloroherpetonaceae bacterium]|nr:protein translocase subunit SecF [Chloroherpetonaceae bacterium]MDW8437503.1 protein translocase subunit SecF [Chloroherpetonaceae bacterium]